MFLANHERNPGIYNPLTNSLHAPTLSSEAIFRRSPNLRNCLSPSGVTTKLAPGQVEMPGREGGGEEG